jgi:Flp pilus assembly protein TadB
MKHAPEDAVCKRRRRRSDRLRRESALRQERLACAREHRRHDVRRRRAKWDVGVAAELPEAVAAKAHRRGRPAHGPQPQIVTIVIIIIVVIIIIIVVIIIIIIIIIIIA